jgi:hypothetical protein
VEKWIPAFAGMTIGGTAESVPDFCEGA